jgi:hypothetical protein
MDFPPPPVPPSPASPLRYPASGGPGFSPRPAPPPEPRRRLSTPVVVIITVIVTAIATSLAWIGIIVALYFQQSSGEEPFHVTADLPERVRVGEAVSLRLSITNPADEPRILDSVDVYESFLEGLEVRALTPHPAETNRILDFTTYSYSRTLAGGESITLVFDYVATKPGYFSGDVDVCTPEQDYTTVRATISVQP